ncbi:dolichol-phosphate mannosyltransferase [Granulicella aggregans]|uniref:Dolichol-phosphate mannosyltransferase n=1 Tax=Granulicella aggregans TaxID=474949 RepID=A0A7W8E392_9BACT|nr:glycosyltransferase family 2 protein [Granulicella aggregans]MBB5057211.1 dolichol-phosphate mannosyltransferase [Granulicella aggregans]
MMNRAIESEPPACTAGLHAEASERRLDLAVVVPTFNERENIPLLISALREALDGLRWEVVFVDDDSPDGTAEIIDEFARRDGSVRLLQRVGRRGLSSACIEGALATSASVIAVMDADMQHDESIIPLMLARLREEGLDVVVGTRNAQGGSMGELSAGRRLLSGVGQRISAAACRCELSDPMSGFFLFRRSFFLEVVHRLHGGGFKILVDILASSERPVRLAEVGYQFRGRLHGESKLDLNNGIELLFLVASKLTGDVIPSRFAVFALVGAVGLFTHMLCLGLLLRGLHWSFNEAQSVAAFVAMTENFFVNNLITYRDRSLRGARLVTGLMSFWLACSFGAWANVSFARSLLQSGMPWIAAGAAGVVLGSVWNYTVSSLFTWQTSRAPAAIAVRERPQPDTETYR